MFIKFMEIMNGLTNQVKIFTNAEKVNKLLRALAKEWSQAKTSVRETMRIQSITMDELITLMSYKAEHFNEESNAKGEKAITFTSNYDDAGNPSTFDEDNDDDMALFTRRLKSLMRKGSNYKGKRQVKF